MYVLFLDCPTFCSRKKAGLIGVLYVKSKLSQTYPTIMQSNTNSVGSSNPTQDQPILYQSGIIWSQSQVLNPVYYNFSLQFNGFRPAHSTLEAPLDFVHPTNSMSNILFNFLHLSGDWTMITKVITPAHLLVKNLNYALVSIPIFAKIAFQYSVLVQIILKHIGSKTSLHNSYLTFTPLIL